MGPEVLDEAVVCLMILTGYLGVLCVGCIIADYVFPHIPFIERWLESLPAWEDEDEDDSLEYDGMIVVDEYSEFTEEQWDWLVERLDKERRDSRHERSGVHKVPACED